MILKSTLVSESIEGAKVEAVSALNSSQTHRHSPSHISKWQLSISCFCPPWFVSRFISAISLSHFAEHHYLIISLQTQSGAETHTPTRMNKHVELCSVFLHCCLTRSLPFPSPVSQIIPYLPHRHGFLSPQLHHSDGEAACVDKKLQSSSAELTVASQAARGAKLFRKKS